MKTKPSQPVPASFPTCGEVFEFLVKALDLPAWAGFFDTSPEIDKTRAKTISGELRAWALETDDRVPSREDFNDFIRTHTVRLPHRDELRQVLKWCVGRVVGEHTVTVRENATYLDREQTRAWYGRGKAPDAVYIVYQLRLLLRRLPQLGGPMLEPPLASCLDTMWKEGAPRYPLSAVCFNHYEKQMSHGGAASFAEGVKEWRAGEIRPGFRSLGDCFLKHPRNLEVLLNFAVARLIESLSETFKTCIPSNDIPTAQKLLGQQASSLSLVDTQLANDEKQSLRFGLEDYIRYLDDRVRDHRAEVVEMMNRSEPSVLDLSLVDLISHRDYYREFSRVVPPPSFKDFYARLSELWVGTALHQPPGDALREGGKLPGLKAEFPAWCEPLAGPIAAIEARLILLREETPTAATLRAGWARYQDAVAESRYRAGTYTSQVLREGLGVAAMIQRRDLGDGDSTLPSITKMLAWWDLVGLGNDFDHEQPAQRVERAERAFTDSWHPDLRKRWRATLPVLGLEHHTVGGLMSFIEPEAMERIGDGVDKRQKRPSPSIATGRDQSPLMEAIDHGDLDGAREFLRKGADLNFRNSTGDSCVTKAFARGFYDLILEILQRGHEPISTATLLRVTNQNKLSGFERAIAHGRLDILREMVRYKSFRREPVDLRVVRVREMSPLFYAVHLLAYPDMLLLAVPNGKRDGVGVMEILEYLIHETPEELDAPNVEDHSALTYAAQLRLQPPALRLLAGGANVNHRCRGGATALCFAIQNDDYEMVKLLLEYRADYRLHVDGLGRPIYAMEMSDRVRQLIPYRV